MALWEANTSTDRAAEIFSSDLASRVKREYAGVFGGQWSLGAGAVGHWYNNVAGLRNRVVHAGYQPSDDEVSTSFGATDELSRHILSRSRTSCSLSAWIFLGNQVSRSAEA